MSTNPDPTGPQYWDPLVGADEDSVPRYIVVDGNGYFNWYAATAGSGTRAMNGWRYTAPDSVCPSGWRVPVYSGSETATWTYLLINKYGLADNATSSDILRQNPLAFTLSGSFNFSNESISMMATYGFYWSSTAYSSDNARDLVFKTDVVQPENNYNKTYGVSVRCLQRQASN